MTAQKPSRDLRHYSFSNPNNDKQQIRFALGPTRERAALDALIRSGARGSNFYDDPAPRWASSIFLLRKRGLDILTVKEPHGGAHPGYHAVYVLQSNVVPVSASCLEEA